MKKNSYLPLVYTAILFVYLHAPAPLRATPFITTSDTEIAAETKDIVCVGKTIIRAADIPYTINVPGVYQLGEDVLSYGGVNPAITVDTSAVPANLQGPVLIDLCSHCLSVTAADAISLVTPADVQNGYLQAKGNPINQIGLISGFIGTIENVTFIGNGSATVEQVDTGIRLSGTPTIKEGNVLNCSFLNIASGIVFFITDPNYVVVIDSCRFSGNATQSVLCTGSPQVIVKDSFFTDSNIFIRMIDFFGSRLTVDNTIFEDLTGTQAGIIVAFVNQLCITNCSFNRLPLGSGININGNHSTNKGTLISNITMNNIGSTGIIVDSNFSKVLLNNIIINSCTTGIQVGNPGYTLDKIFIHNCTVNHATSTGIFIRSISTPATPNIYVESCSVLNCGVSGIDVNNANGGASVIVNNCSAINCGGILPGTNYTGVNFSLLSEDNADTSAAGFFFRNISR